MLCFTGANEHLAVRVQGGMSAKIIGTLTCSYSQLKVDATLSVRSGRNKPMEVLWSCAIYFDS